ncbi:hypothetical protein [Aquimarina longa]|uniref:hypothetical protein n=1 Tax=Aquimarina longa TaxID=1080221 RepID=UPI000784898E|nr:hypothetical protein [Aquimarina longa]
MKQNINRTVAFDDSPEIKGWTSFFSYIPDIMIGMNNNFFSFKNGDLYEHHIGERNTFYDQKSPSTICVVFNDFPSDDKIFKTIFLESNQAWNIALETNYTNSTILSNEFQKKESRWFAYTRRSENNEDLTGISVTGIGKLIDYTNNIATFSHIDGSINIGDGLYQIINDNAELIGEINFKTATTLSLDSSSIMTPIERCFCFSKKNSRVESGSVRGYYMKVELENDEDEHVELFAVNSKAVKSYV